MSEKIIVETLSKTILDANSITVTAGTNCPQGGDTGHGGRTVIKIKDNGSTDIRVRINGEEPKSVESIEIFLGGDAEYRTFEEGFEFIVETLKNQHRRNKEKQELVKIEIPGY
jgi:hypothetical protein